MGKSVRMLACVGFSLALLACSSEPRWQLTKIDGHLPELRFSGSSETGAQIDSAVLQGQVVLLYFGFSHCVEDCPIVMARLAAVLNDLAADASQVRILVDSLDPAHDAAPVLQRYLALFDARHSVGLTASDEETEALAKRYRIAFYPAHNQPLEADIPHSDAVYVFDQSGRARLLITPRDSNAVIESDLHRLVAERSTTR